MRHSLPVGILGMRASGELYRLVACLKRDVEPRQECMNIYMRVNRREDIETSIYAQSLRVAVNVYGTLKVRSSFFTVRRLMCYVLVNSSQNPTRSAMNAYLDHARVRDDGLELHGVYQRFTERDILYT